MTDRKSRKREIARNKRRSEKMATHIINSSGYENP
jgi:hypothetical protein